MNRDQVHEMMRNAMECCFIVTRIVETKNTFEHVIPVTAFGTFGSFCRQIKINNTMTKIRFGEKKEKQINN